MVDIPHQRTAPPEGLEGYTLEQLGSIWATLDTGQRAFIKGYYERARRLHKEATDAWNKRADRLAYLLDYCRVNRYTDFQTREKIIKDWVFSDASDDWLRFNREIRRCHAAIDMELKMHSLFLIEVEVPSAR